MRLPAVALAVLVSYGLGGCAGGADPAGGDPAAAVVSGRSDTGGALAGREVRPAFTLPDAELVTDDGADVRLADDLDRPVTVFFFGYTLCPDVCPLVMADLSLALARLPAKAAGQVQVAFVTSDPVRDTPQVLRAWLDRFDPEFTGYTGTLTTIAEVAEQMGVPVDQGQRLPSGGYDVTHGAELVGYVGARGVVVWPQGTSVDDLTRDLAALVAEAAAGRRG